MGTPQHGVEVSAQPEVLDHLRERVSETDELLPHHGVGAREEQEVLEQLSRESAPETQRFVPLQVVEADGQQEIQENVSTERPPEDCGEQVAEAEDGDLQKVHETQHHQEVLWQAYGERDLEVAEGSRVKSEEGTSQQETHMGTPQHGVEVSAQPEVLDHLRERVSETDELLPHHGVGAREEQEVLEELSRESAPETQRFIPLQVGEVDGQQEIQKNVSTERAPEVTGSSNISAPENGGCLAVRQTVAAVGRVPQVLAQPFDKNLREDIFGEGPALVGQLKPEAPRNDRGVRGRRSLDQVVLEATGASKISAPETRGCLPVRQTVAVAGRVPQVLEQTFDKNLREDVFGEGPSVGGQRNPEAPIPGNLEVEAGRRSWDQVVWEGTSACSGQSQRDGHEDLNHENEDDLEDELRKIRESHRFRSRAHTVEHSQALHAVEELLEKKEGEPLRRIRGLKAVHDEGGDENKRAPQKNQSDMKTVHVGRGEETAAHDDVRETSMPGVAPAGGTEPDVSHEVCGAPGCQSEATPSRNLEQVTDEMPAPVLVQEDHQPHHLAAFTVQVPPAYPGLQYRRSKHIDDRLEFYEASGKDVYGYLEDRGKWLHVRTGLYLPVEVGNSRVLYPVQGVKPTGGLGVLNSSTGESLHRPAAGVSVGVDSDQPRIKSEFSEVDGGGGFWSFLCCSASAWSTDGNRRRDAVDATDLVLTGSR